MTASFWYRTDDIIIHECIVCQEVFVTVDENS